MKFIKTLLPISLILANSMMQTAWGITMAEARKKVPELSGLDDETAIKFLQRTYYTDLSLAELASHLGVTLKQPKKLGPIDKWRFEACQSDAAKAPTSSGVAVGLRVCNDRFDQ